MISLPSFPKLARQNVIVLASCVGALLLFASVALLPDLHKHKLQTRAISNLQARLNEQQDLNVLYRQLEGKIAALGKLDEEPPAKPAPLPAGEIGRIAQTLHALAQQEGLQVVEVRPAIESGDISSHRVRVQAVLHGHLEQHRALLLDLLREPYVEDVERIVLAANGKDITLRIILAINIA